ncbi:protein aspartic protease in guard cell 2 [Quercus suber]|uniref:Protein aspartic protease in guard cell 2 n=1 Tax=Quercus suber TaxID=58331 RepID=A0AAW0LV17_QUESU
MVPVRVLLMVLVLNLLTSITATTNSNSSTTTTTTSSSSHANAISYPDFQHLNIKEIIAETKTKPTITSQNHQPLDTHDDDDDDDDDTKFKSTEKKSWKLKLVHRDGISKDNLNDHYRHRFLQRMKRDIRRNGGCHAGRCRYEVQYGDGSYTKGTLAFETLTFGQTAIRNVAIGCGHINKGMFVGAAGLLGLGSGSMSFVGQLGGQAGGAFSYCLVSRGTGSSGSLEFGRGAMPVGAAWVPLIRNPQAPSYYYVGLAGLGVGGMQIPVSEDVFRLTDTGKGGVVMDTGTAVTRFPTLAYEAFRDAFISQTSNLPRASGVSIFDTCYNLLGFVSVRVPTVSFYFSDGPILTLPARNFLIPVDDAGTFCFAFAPSPSSGPSIIGNIQQEGIQISFDGANGFVGFGPNVC